jgi:hypothetical protein
MQAENKTARLLAAPFLFSGVDLAVGFYKMFSR